MLAHCAQIYAKARKDIPGLTNQVEKGEFAELKAWLNKNVHALGSLHASGGEWQWLPRICMPLGPCIQVAVSGGDCLRKAWRAHRRIMLPSATPSCLRLAG